MFGLIELHVCILNSIYEKGVSLTMSLPALFRRSAMVEFLLTRITQLNIVKPVNSLSMKPNIIKPLVSFISSSDLQIDAWHSNCNRTVLQHIENPRIVLCVYNIDIKPTGPHYQRSASPFPPLPPQLKSPGARHKADSRWQISSQKKTTHGLFSSDVNIDRKTKPHSAKAMSPLAGSNRGPQDND
jgi:hypothetical protein